MPIFKTLAIHALTAALSLPLGFGPALAAQSSAQVQVACDDPSNLSAANPEYVATLSEMLKNMGAKTVKCTSCYRSPERQLNTCMKICGKPSCPNLCAAPGSSQHQRKNVATCDLSGMPDGTCWALKKLCDEKYGGKCGIGGYKGGGYHFGVGDYRFSSWNRCAGLPRAPGSMGSYGPPGEYTKVPRFDPNDGDGSSEVEAQALIGKHEIIIAAALVVAGTSGYLLYKKWRGK